MPRPGVSFVLLCLFMACLWLAGGASRGWVAGQVVVRAAAWAAMVAMILAGPRPVVASRRPVLWVLVAAIALALAQLIPLPPAVWSSLPGRSLFLEAATLSGQPQPWRPWAIVPGAAVNAAASLVVPAVTLLLLCGLKPGERHWLPGAVLCLVTASALVGVLQASGGAFDNPLINETPGMISGTLANRNHFALLMAIGCLILPAWALPGGHRPGWRGAVALALLLLFVLSILASGSRTGLLLGGMAIVLGLASMRHDLRQLLARYPRWLFVAVAGGVVTLLAIAILFSIAADRAISIQRVFSVDTEQDLRARTLPTVLAMLRLYFPFGIGLGGFDPLFRLHEPFALLKPLYFNQAHNDFLGIVIDAGLPGALLLAAGLGWWAWASIRAWRGGTTAEGGGKGGGRNMARARLGSGIMLLIAVASVFDYPARTPVIMAVLVIAACWLAEGQAASGEPPLPHEGQHL